MSSVEQKLERLREIVRELGGALVAYSGGVDSSLMLDVAVEVLGAGRVLGVVANSETLTTSEFERASAIAKERGWPLEAVRYSELEIDNYAENPINRCFFCKNEMYDRLAEVARERGLPAVLDGSNADDAGDHRPGMIAARKLGVRSPLLEADLTKDEVRAEARRRGLPNWDKPAGACLSSRVPYGQKITREKIDQIGAAEEFLLGELGFSNCRARHYGDTIRLELPAEEVARAADPAIRERLVERLKSLGFLYVTLDLEGYRSGSMNDVLPTERAKLAERFAEGR
jgi:uncharacterized protein